MAYYIGTLQQCEDYDRQVVIGEGYGRNPDDVTAKYAEPVKHPTQNKYAIKKHSSYEDENMNLVESLSSDWFPEQENL